MLLKRTYTEMNGNKVVTGVRVLRVGNRQKFSPNFVQIGNAEGWLFIGGGQLVINCQDNGELKFDVKRYPGAYCCHCQKPIPDANLLKDGKTMGMWHVEQNHPGKMSPDRNNPAGYEVVSYYDCYRTGTQINHPSVPAGNAIPPSWIDKLRKAVIG